MNMRMSRIALGVALASMGLNYELSRATEGLSALADVMRKTQPSYYKSKPNKLSQKKRRLIARRNGK